MLQVQTKQNKHAWLLYSTTSTIKAKETKCEIRTYRNHNTLTEDRFWYEYPKDVINKCTTKKYSSNLQCDLDVIIKNECNVKYESKQLTYLDIRQSGHLQDCYHQTDTLSHLTSENERRKKDLKNYAYDFSKLHTQPKYNILQQTNRYIIVQQLEIRNNTKKKIHFTYTGWFCL